MTKDEFWNKFRGRLMLFLADVWAARKEPPSALGILFDKHMITMRSISDAQYDTLTSVQEVKKLPTTNGQPQRPEMRK